MKYVEAVELYIRNIFKDVSPIMACCKKISVQQLIVYICMYFYTCYRESITLSWKSLRAIFPYVGL